MGVSRLLPLLEHGCSRLFQRLGTVGGARRSVNAAHLTITLNGDVWLWDEGGSALDSYRQCPLCPVCTASCPHAGGNVRAKLCSLERGQVETSDHRDVLLQATARKAKGKVMPEHKGNEAIWDLVTSFREGNQAVAESIGAIQEHNLKYAQGLLINGMEVLKSQMESTQTLIQEVGQQIQKQQEAFQRLARESAGFYIDFLLAPLVYSQRAVRLAMEAAETGMRERGEPVVRK